MKLQSVLLSALLGGCAFVKDLSETFDSYKPIPMNGKFSKQLITTEFKKYANNLNIFSLKEEGADYVIFDSVTFLKVNVVYRCNFVMGIVNDNLHLNQRKCKVLNVNPDNGVVKWDNVGFDAPNNIRQAFTYDFFYNRIDSTNPKKDSLLKSITMPSILSENDLNRYINNHIVHKH